MVLFEHPQNMLKLMGKKIFTILRSKTLFYLTCDVIINQPDKHTIIEPVHEISNNVVCATSKASDQPAHTPSLIRAFASPLSII